MSLREKYAAAKAARPWRLSQDQILMNYALQVFTREIPQIIDTAIDRMKAGDTLLPERDPLFMRETTIPDVIRSFGDAQEKLARLTRLPAMQGLKAYLSDPAIDMAFTAEITGKYTQGSYVETLRLTVHPENPFDQSYLAYTDGLNRRVRQMEEADKNAWMAVSKPKLAPPAKLGSPSSK